MASPGASQSPSQRHQLRCFAVTPSAAFLLRKADVADIVIAVRKARRRPVVSIEMPELDERAPRRIVQVVALVHGNCANGDGERLWVRKGARGWRVVKKLDGPTWGTFG